MILTYKPHAMIEDLGLNECTVHRASGSAAARWWLLWFRVLREIDVAPAVFCVPVSPILSSPTPTPTEGLTDPKFNPSVAENGPGGRTWRLTRTLCQGVWQIDPSINILEHGDAADGTHPDFSVWHHTPTIVNVSDTESWAMGQAP